MWIIVALLFLVNFPIKYNYKIANRLKFYLWEILSDYKTRYNTITDLYDLKYTATIAQSVTCTYG